MRNEGKAGKCLKRMAPQVGLEPTTLRLTAECSAIELLRNVAALARVVVKYKEIVTSDEAERQTPAIEICKIPAGVDTCRKGRPVWSVIGAVSLLRSAQPRLEFADAAQGDWRRQNQESRSTFHRRAQ